MSYALRKFGRPASLQDLMKRGEEFFEVVNETPIEEVLDRSKRISRVAFTAAELTAEKLQLEGDGTSKQLVFAAYLSLHDITAGTLDVTDDIEKTEELLTSDRTHRTLLLASKTLRSYAFDKTTKMYRRQGAGFELADDGLVFQTGYKIPEKDKGLGCPYAQGNAEKADFFNLCTDNIVRTYTEAYRRHMPENLLSQVLRR